MSATGHGTRCPGFGPADTCIRPRDHAGPCRMPNEPADQAEAHAAFSTAAPSLVSDLLAEVENLRSTVESDLNYQRRLEGTVKRLAAERDEARAEVERLRAEVSQWQSRSFETVATSLNAQRRSGDRQDAIDRVRALADVDIEPCVDYGGREVIHMIREALDGTDV